MKYKHEKALLTVLKAKMPLHELYSSLGNGFFVVRADCLLSGCLAPWAAQLKFVSDSEFQG
ncbi:hypothetical protein [Desulfitobacterium hafniense]|uniref:hypothetical protein n=1 Tax=Desulfitobacterium hafniense TaxID=49338 RepID=UPI000045B019|nr:hypothetical protein [Desulfitobacterium hafniense]